ncbi:MAG TPA: NADH-quinone oxidoreductase subunit J [Candidatus Methylacidiphilales bacterium]|nr:NADH-quinone oxidoreductase subunit J [Candidatus Methylacidiphilales bacterium]
MDALFFWFFSFLMTLGGLGVILSRNPVASALCFAFSLVNMAALFIMLGAYFLAAVQILVTAGGVMVLFLFIIMLLDVTVAGKAPRQKTWTGFALALGLMFIYLVALTLNATPRGLVPQNTIPLETYRSVPAASAISSGLVDDTQRIGNRLFTHFVAPFEITSLLILVAIIGVIVICKEDEPARSSRDEISREAPPIPREKETALTP